MLALAALLGVWSYPVFILAGLVEALAVLWLYKPQPAGWVMAALQRRSKWLLVGGRVLAVFLGGLIFGPLFSTALVKYLGFSGRRGVLLALVVVVLVRGISASFYLGAAEVLKEFLFNVG
jgi:hypothetical protein